MANKQSFTPEESGGGSEPHYVGCRGLPGSCHGRCEGDELCRNLVSSDGKRYCGCSANPQ